MSLEQHVLDALKTVLVPDLQQDIVTLGMVENLKVAHGIATFSITLSPQSAGLQATLTPAIKSALQGVTGLNDHAVHYLVRPTKAVPRGPEGIPGIRHILAIGSGKGGVGKSTVSVNLALALKQLGYRVGLLDADIYGPSIPFLMGVQAHKPLVKDNQLQPIISHGISLMSMGFLLPNADDPIVWRGPMLASAMRQFFRDVAWGELDYLLVDLPPGTGDVPLSLVQLIPLTGAVIVITPQAVAAAIGVKTLRMLQQSKVPILGVVENMSHFVCPQCETATPIFASGGAQAVAEREGIALLGQLPLDPGIRASGDVGLPLVVQDPHSPSAKAFLDLAENLQSAMPSPAQTEAGTP